MLRLHEVEAGYGSAQVLFGVSFAIEAGACVSLMGRNGMGKTTTVRTIMGQLPLRGGSIDRFGDATPGRESFELARAGIGLVPEGRQIFSNLTVVEKLSTFHRPARDGETLWTMDTVLDLFPRLRERLGHHHWGKPNRAIQNRGWRLAPRRRVGAVCGLDAFVHGHHRVLAQVDQEGARRLDRHFGGFWHHGRIGLGHENGG